MQKNKLAVMFLTLIIMIAITPFIFSKLMNSKYDTMLLKLSQNEGLKIKEKEDKSTYLITDRYFEVKIPGKTLHIPGVRYIVADIETKFKNLPVTQVEFDGVIKDVVFVDRKDNEIFPEFLKGIKFVVITPDFRVYRYKILDEDKNVRGVEFSLKGINGIFNLANKENNLKGRLIKIANTQMGLEIRDFSQQAYFTKNFSQNLKYSLFIKGPNLDIKVLNENDFYKISLNKDVNLSFRSAFNKLSINNGFFEVDNFNGKLSLLNLDKAVLSSDVNKKLEILNKGFRGDFELDVKNIRFIQNLGFIQAKGEFQILPGNNVEKLRNNNFDFVNAKFYIKTSPKIYEAIKNFAPEFKRFFKVKNKKVEANIEIKKGKIEVKSN